MVADAGNYLIPQPFQGLTTPATFNSFSMIMGTYQNDPGKMGRES
jgi:hypothetical protein